MLNVEQISESENDMKTYLFQGYNDKGLDYQLATTDRSKVIALQSEYTGKGNHFLVFDYSNHLNLLKPAHFVGVKFN